MAVEKHVRIIVFHRDTARCQGCGKTWDDGWMLHVAHYPKMHRRKHPLYYTAEAVRLLCIECHIKDHLFGTTLGRKADEWAISKLETKSHYRYGYG